MEKTNGNILRDEVIKLLTITVEVLIYSQLSAELSLQASPSKLSHLTNQAPYPVANPICNPNHNDFIDTSENPAKKKRKNSEIEPAKPKALIKETSKKKKNCEEYEKNGTRPIFTPEETLQRKKVSWDVQESNFHLEITFYPKKIKARRSDMIYCGLERILIREYL
jgi:hypothetical protein